MTGEPEPLMKWLVDKHNELRYRHGVQLLTWDWSLAWNAYNYITACPTGHSGQQGIGENLAWGHNDFNHAMRDWYDEVRCQLGICVFTQHLGMHLTLGLTAQVPWQCSQQRQSVLTPLMQRRRRCQGAILVCWAQSPPGCRWLLLPAVPVLQLQRTRVCRKHGPLHTE
jgi:hypothetical protein